MKVLRESNNGAKWPRKETKFIDCRKKDLVIRISNWMKDKNEPAFDVECYIGGIYDWNESESFTIHSHKTKEKCKQLVIEFAQKQIAKLL